jgi:hypothetical protein
MHAVPVCFLGSSASLVANRKNLCLDDRKASRGRLCMVSRYRTKRRSFFGVFLGVLVLGSVYRFETW